MKHERAWERLPDLLGPRDDAPLLAHVAGCHTCQRQLFLLERVDRMLRDARATNVGAVNVTRMHFRLAALLAALAVAAAAALVLVLPRPSGEHGFVLRTADGRALGRATVVRTDRSNEQLSLVARGMTRAGGSQLLLWAQSAEGAGPIPVGRFMVDSRGDCRTAFTLPTNHRWTRFWVTSSTDPSVVVATT